MSFKRSAGFPTERGHFWPRISLNLRYSHLRFRGYQAMLSHDTRYDDFLGPEMVGIELKLALTLEQHATP
jgi:hypothetical protein